MPVNCELCPYCHSFTELWVCPSLSRPGLGKESGSQRWNCGIFVFPVLPSDHGIAFNAQLLDFLSRSWMILVDPFQLRDTSPSPTLGGCHHQGKQKHREAVQREIYWLGTCSWPDLGKKRREKRIVALLQFYPNTPSGWGRQLISFPWFAWLDIADWPPGWGMLMASAEMLDSFQVLFFQRLGRKEGDSTWK